MKSFSQKKFTSLPLQRQHKKAAELLRELYKCLDKESPPISSTKEMLAKQYTEISQWMQLKTFDCFNMKQISDFYHWHLEKACCFLQEHNFLPHIRKGDREYGEEPLSISIFLDNIRSAHNVGSIIRTTEAFSLGSLYFSERMPFADHKQVQDASMGTCQWVPCYRDIPINKLPQPVILLETSSQASSIFDFKFPDKFTLVLGNEEYGCSDESIQESEAIVEIPLVGRKNSINVANAYAIAANEIHRQKRSHLRKNT